MSESPQSTNATPRRRRMDRYKDNPETGETFSQQTTYNDEKTTQLDMNTFSSERQDPLLDTSMLSQSPVSTMKQNFQSTSSASIQTASQSSHTTNQHAAESLLKKIKTFLLEVNSFNLKKGMIVALLCGVAMIYIPLFSGYYRYSGLFDTSILLQIALAVTCVLFLNRNRIISLALLMVYAVVLCLDAGFYSFIPFWYRYYPGDAKYMLFSYAHVIEAFFVFGYLIAINKGKRPLATGFSLLFAAWEIAWIFSSELNIPNIYHSSVYGVMFLWAGYYIELLLPVLMLLCSVKPRIIRTSILVVDGYIAVRMILFVAGDVLVMLERSGYNEHLNFMFLLNMWWLPVILILGLNSYLLFPIPFREIVKIFFMSLLAIVFVAIIAMAQQDINNAESEREERREAYLNDMRDNILTWKEAGFSESFTLDVAKDMLNEGRITYSEYQWLVKELLAKG